VIGAGAVLEIGQRFGIAAFAVCLCSLASCGVLPNPSDPFDIAARTEISRDRYDGLWKALGPKVLPIGNNVVDSYRLRAFSKDRDFGRLTVAQLYVVADVNEWLFLNRAHAAGAAFHVTQIDREVAYCTEERCTLRETVGVDLSIEQMRALAAGPGFDVRISGRRGSMTIFVPAAYFQGFLMAIGKAR